MLRETFCEKKKKSEKISALQLRFISATIAVKIGEVCTWKPEKLLEALHTAEKLKDTTRHCYTSKGRHESVAEHSWRIALMAFWLRDEFPQADMDKVIRMCLIHDLGECFTGDIPAFDKTAADEAAEEALLSRCRFTARAGLYRDADAVRGDGRLADDGGQNLQSAG